MSVRSHYIRLIPFVLIISLYSCSQSSVKENIDNQASEIINKTNDEIVIKRYEQALFRLNPEMLKRELPAIYPDYSVFLGDNWQDTMNLIRLYNYLKDKDIREIYEEVQKVYPDLLFLQKAIKEPFQILRNSYPSLKDPVIYTYVSGLDIDNPVMYADTVMIVALDNFLGKDAGVYKKAGIPVYKTLRMNRENLVPSCLAAVARSLIRIDDTKMSLLDQMIAEGKTLYMLDQLLPKTSDELKIGYTSAQLEWCKTNEANIWGYMVENRYLYSTDVQASVKFINDAPFTSGLVNESPGRLGAWVGWQIVKSYMKNFPETSLQDLMNNIDSQAILTQSKYRPRK